VKTADIKNAKRCFFIGICLEIKMGTTLYAIKLCKNEILNTLLPPYYFPKIKRILSSAKPAWFIKIIKFVSVLNVYKNLIYVTDYR